MRCPTPRHLQHTCALHVHDTNLRAFPVPRYKQQLSAAEDRERGLEREKAQLELDWRHRCDGLERRRDLEAEDLIRALSEAREQVCVLGLLGGLGSPRGSWTRAPGRHHAVVRVGRCQASASSLSCNNED